MFLGYEFLGYDINFWLIAITVTLLVAIAKTAFGGVGATIATPLLALVMPVGEAAALLLPILIAADIIAVYHYRRQIDTFHLKRTLPAAIVGILIGSLFFQSLISHEKLLKISIGIISIAFVVFQLFRSRLIEQLKQPPGKLGGVVMGAASGFGSTLAHVGGPPFYVYLLPQNLPKDIFVGTNAIFFFIVNVLKLIPYALLGLLSLGDIPVITLLMLFIPLGAYLGRIFNRLVSPQFFNFLIYGLLLLTGLQLISGKNLVSLIFG